MGLLILLLLSSCSIKKKLGGNKLLIKNTVSIVSDEEIKNKSGLKSSLSSFIRQKPNGTTLFIPGEYLNEDPVIYAKSETEKSVNDMQNYLRNKRGYYYAEVTYDSIVNGKNILINYIVDPKQQYKIGSIKYYGKDKAILKKIESLNDEALLKTGDPIDASLFDLELSRITLALQNMGYANFASNYFKIRGDSSNVDHTVDMYMEVLPPLPDSVHTQYTLGDIKIYTDYHRNQKQEQLDSNVYDNKDYYHQSSDFIVRPSSINNMVFLEEGEIYSRESRSKTFRKLSELGTYKFVTISPTISSLSDSVLNYDIFLTPQQHKWVADFGSELFYSTVNQNANQLFGVSLSSQFKNRNFMGGAEQFTIGTEAGLEMQLPLQVRTINLSLNANLEIPKQVDIYNMAKVLTTFSILPKNEYRRFKEETKTNIGTGINFINVFDNYSITSVSGDYSYDYKRNTNTRYRITTIGVDLNIYNLKEPFLIQNKDNKLLLNTFEDNLLTGFLFRNLTYINTTPQNSRGFSKTFILGFEASGWEKSLVNGLYNIVSGSDSDWKIGEIAFAKYLRLELDQRWYQKVSRRSSLAFRAYAGGIVPFGSDNAAPFVRQFFVGGPNSIRAWDQRELGPGAYSSALVSPTAGQTFFQQGDLKLELNVEYRFPVIWLLEGALFMDAGNVWTLKNDVERPGAQISTALLNDFAIGVGYGLRWDFNYFNIRFDFGYKLKNPYHERDALPSDFTNGYWYNWKGIRNQGFGNFQVAVNYPF